MNRIASIIICFFILFNLFSPVFAEDEEKNISLQDLPKQLTERLGLPTTNNYFAGRLLGSAIFLMLFLLPTIFACNRFQQDALLPSLFVGFIVLGFCIALGWLDYWFLLIITLVVALMFSGKMRDWISGGDR